MQLGSTSRNINLLTLSITISTVLGLINLEMFTLYNIFITVASFYILNILGNWMTLHRYYSHKSFEFKNSLLQWIFTLLAILAGRGSPLGWTYLHRKHHA
jgi:stearoyl-CoA desaturase (delta-9 desaturase)